MRQVVEGGFAVQGFGLMVAGTERMIVHGLCVFC